LPIITQISKGKQKYCGKSRNANSSKLCKYCKLTIHAVIKHLIEQKSTCLHRQCSSAVTDCHTGVLHESVLIPILFSLYILPIADPVLQYGVSLQQYADDTQLYIACSVNDAASALSTLESCLTSLHSWFCHSGLALVAM